MVNTEAFIARLEKVLHFYGLSASAFADQIGVQRSSISHLLTGRNKPSLDFVLRVVKTYPEVNLYWLLNGKGTFPAQRGADPLSSSSEAKSEISSPSNKSIEKIIIFYDDGSFEAFNR